MQTYESDFSTKNSYTIKHCSYTAFKTHQKTSCCLVAWLFSLFYISSQCCAQSFLGIPVHIATVCFGATKGFSSWLGTLVENILEFKMNVPTWSNVFLQILLLNIKKQY